MKYLEISLIPIVMLVSYYLGLTTRVLIRRSQYSQHFVLEHYELNPLWQSDQLHWFSFPYFALVIFVTFILGFFALLTSALPSFYEFFLGFIMVFFLAEVGKNLTLILTCLYLLKNPQALTGEVRMTQQMTLKQSQYSYFMVLLPTLTIALFIGSPFVIGGTVSIIIAILRHYLWYRRAQKPPA